MQCWSNKPTRCWDLYQCWRTGEPLLLVLKLWKVSLPVILLFLPQQESRSYGPIYLFLIQMLPMSRTRNFICRNFLWVYRVSAPIGISRSTQNAQPSNTPDEFGLAFSVACCQGISRPCSESHGARQYHLGFWSLPFSDRLAVALADGNQRAHLLRLESQLVQPPMPARSRPPVSQMQGPWSQSSSLSKTSLLSYFYMETQVTTFRS